MPLPLHVQRPLALLVVPYTRCSGLHACSLYVLMKHDEGRSPYLRNCLRTEALPQDHPWPERGADRRGAIRGGRSRRRAAKERGDPWRLNEEATPTTGLPST